MNLSQAKQRGWRYARLFFLALLTPLLEKNPSKAKTFSRCHVPMVLSMARVIVILFAAAMLRQIRLAGVAGWPEATLSIAIVLAIPFLSALERVTPEKAVEAVRSVFVRAGEGATRMVGSVYSAEPGKHDDHTNDAETVTTLPREQRGNRRGLQLRKA